MHNDNFRSKWWIKGIQALSQKVDVFPPSFPYFETEAKFKLKDGRGGRANSSCWALVVKQEGVEKGGGTRGNKRR